MKRLVPFILIISLVIPAPSAFAFYDDVHYYLNYYLARVIGYTPEQSYRMAKAAVSVDYAPSTEPTQMDLIKATLKLTPTEIANDTELAGVLSDTGKLSNLLWAYFEEENMLDSDRIKDRIDALPASAAALAKEPAFDHVFAPQWKYHAFRDIRRFPLAKVDGPPYQNPEEENRSLAADAAILEQRKLLFQEALHEKNPGIFLHFFQDEVPHHGYSTGGGHWVLYPEQWEQNALWRSAVHEGKRFPAWTDYWAKSLDYDKKGAMPSGSTTDWLTWRSHDSNLDMMTKTAQFMIDFMNESSQGKQRPRMSAQEAVRIANQGFVLALRYANIAPRSLTNMQEVLKTQSLQATHGEKKKGSAEDEEKFGQQADGPNLAAAEKVVNEALTALGAENVPPFPHEHKEKVKWSYQLVNRSDSNGATFVDTDGRQLLYVDLRIKVNDASVVNKSAAAPKQIEVILNSVSSKRNEDPYVIDKKSTNAFGALDGSEVLLDFSRIPAGDVLIEIRYLDSNNAVIKAFDKKVKLEARSTDVTVEAPNAGSIRSAVADAFHSLGLTVTFAHVPNPDFSKTVPLDVVAGKIGTSKNNASDSIIHAEATIFDDETYAKQAGTQIQGDFSVGVDEPALARSRRIILYPSAGTRYPKGVAEGKFRCGLVIIWLNTIAESDRGFNQGENQTEFDQEEKRLGPEALANNKDWLIKIAKALGNYSVCRVSGVTASPASPNTSETGISGDKGPSDTYTRPSPAPGTEPAQTVKEGEVVIDGLGDKTIEINTGSGWSNQRNGDVIPVGKFPAGITVRTSVGSPTLKFPAARRMVLSAGSELILRGTKGDLAITSGGVKVFNPGQGAGSVVISTPVADVAETGTIFSVSHDVATNVTTVEVEEGEVVITPRNPVQPRMTLKAGDKVKVSGGGEITTGKPSDVTGIIDYAPPAVGAEPTPGASSSGTEFERRVRHVFNSPGIADGVALDTFAAISLVIARRNLPGSCYSDDPHVRVPSWDAHRQWAIDHGRQKSGDNVIWKTGGTLACLSNQNEKDALIAEINEILRQAENGNVARVADLPTASSGQSASDVPAVAGIYRWDWANSGEPVNQGATVTLNVDGTASSSYGHQGRWRIENGTIVIDWAHGDKSDLRPTSDPDVWEGGNPAGARIRAMKQVAYNFGKDPVQASNIPGVWKWDWNRSGEPVDQGASATFYIDGSTTSSYAGYYGTWTVDGGKVNLLWTNVNQTNTLYSTPDPNVLEGWGQFGERIRATKQQSITAQNPSYEYGIDRPGWDYNKFTLSAPNPDLCASQCQQDSQCRAWTYVKPGYQAPEAMCWLKNSVPPQVKGADFAVSGVTRP